jgi:hypothetical protein
LASILLPRFDRSAFSGDVFGRQYHRSLAATAFELDAARDVASHQISAFAAKDIALALWRGAIARVAYIASALLRLILINHS